MDKTAETKGYMYTPEEAFFLPGFIYFYLFTLHAPLLWSNTTCTDVTYLYSSLPFLFIVWLLITLFYL